MSLIGQYCGGDRAWQWLEGERERLSRATLLRAGVARNTLRMVRACALLAALSGASAQRTQQIHKQVRRSMRQMHGSTSTFTDVTRLTLELQLIVLARDQAGLQDFIVRARSLPTFSSNVLHEMGITLAEGYLAGGEARQRALDQAFALFSEQGWRNPARAIAMIWPAFSEL
jgi:hypothetical protein